MDLFNLFGNPKNKNKNKTNKNKNKKTQTNKKQTNKNKTKTKTNKKNLYFEKSRPLSGESLQGVLVYLYG